MALKPSLSQDCDEGRVDGLRIVARVHSGCAAAFGASNGFGGGFAAPREKKRLVVGQFAAKRGRRAWAVGEKKRVARMRGALFFGMGSR